MFWPSLISDSLTQTADAAAGTESLTVTRNGEPFHTGPFITDAFDVPAGEATYQATAAVTRAAPAGLSTSVSTSWTFRSGPAAKKQPLPVAAIRFAPALNEDNVAPVSNGPFVIPVTVQAQAGAAMGPTRKLTVEASYDDGKTWTAAWLSGGTDRQFAMVWHPKGHGYVSLRAKATSACGSTVEQTIVRAYRF
jgi:hypothetical protein